MKLDGIKLQTTWNDAAESINKNFGKISNAIRQGLPVIDTPVDDELSEESDNAIANRPVAKALKEKQNILISGENIKTINGVSILGEGNIVIQGGEGTTAIPDWNASENEEGFIKNRTHYKQFGSWANISISGGTANIYGISDYDYIILNSSSHKEPIGLAENKRYNVTFDGIGLVQITIIPADNTIKVVATNGSISEDFINENIRPFTIVPLGMEYLPKGLATEEYVNEKIADIEVSGGGAGLKYSVERTVYLTEIHEGGDHQLEITEEERAYNIETVNKVCDEGEAVFISLFGVFFFLWVSGYSDGKRYATFGNIAEYDGVLFSTKVTITSEGDAIVVSEEIQTGSAPTTKSDFNSDFSKDF
jgi:hypothetical protein